MSELRRYEATLVHKCGENPYMVMASADDGDYCEYQQAADEITRLRQLLSEAEKRERETLTQLSEIAKKEAEGLMDKWISDQGTTVETKAAGVASHIVNDFRGHIEAALIKLERRAALERSEG